MQYILIQYASFLQQPTKMKLLEYLYDRGLYVSNEDEILYYITNHIQVIDSLEEATRIYMDFFPNAVHILYVEDNKLVYEIMFDDAEQRNKAMFLVRSLQKQVPEFVICFSIKC